MKDVFLDWVQNGERQWTLGRLSPARQPSMQTATSTAMPSIAHTQTVTPTETPKDTLPTNAPLFTHGQKRSREEAVGAGPHGEGEHEEGPVLKRRTRGARRQNMVL